MNYLLERLKSPVLELPVDTAISLFKDYLSISISGSMAAYALSKG